LYWFNNARKSEKKPQGLVARLDNPVVLLINKLIPVAAVVLTDVPGLITTLPVLKAAQVGVLVPQLIIIHPVGKLLVVVL